MTNITNIDKDAKYRCTTCRELQENCECRPDSHAPIMQQPFMPIMPRTPKRKKWLHTVFTNAIETSIQHWALIDEYHYMKAGVVLTKSGANTAGQVEDHDNFYAIIVSNDDEDGWGLGDDPNSPFVDHPHPQKSTPEQPVMISDFDSLRIDINTIERGIQRFWEYCLGHRDDLGRLQDPLNNRCPIDQDHYWRQFLVADLTNGIDGDYDATVTDTIIQLALFNEVVYG